jgi:hypothetical protein
MSRSNKDQQSSGSPTHGGTSNAGQGQQKLHTITNGQTGETREISQEEWRTQGAQLRAEGWTRPEEATETETGSAGDEPTGGEPA